MLKAFSKLPEGELKCFSDLADAVKRIEVLFDNGNLRDPPFWCFRGTASMQVDEFHSPGSLRLDFGWGRFTVQKLAAYRGHEPFRDFIYLETDSRSFKNFFLTGSFSPYNDSDYRDQKATKEDLDRLAAGEVSLEQMLPDLLIKPPHPEEQKADEEK